MLLLIAVPRTARGKWSNVLLIGGALVMMEWGKSIYERVGYSRVSPEVGSMLK